MSLSHAHVKKRLSMGVSLPAAAASRLWKTRRGIGDREGKVQGEHTGWKFACKDKRQCDAQYRGDDQEFADLCLAWALSCKQANCALAGLLVSTRVNEVNNGGQSGEVLKSIRLTLRSTLVLCSSLVGERAL